MHEIWAASEKDKGHQRVAETIESKKELQVMKTVSKATIIE